MFVWLLTVLIAAAIVAAIVSRLAQKAPSGTNVSGTIAFKRKLQMKVRRPGFKEPILEQVVGDDLHQASRRWMKRSRRIDRLHNWYHETVTDPRTGRIVHECKEPLSEHQGHGSAKPSNRKRHA